MTLSKERQLSSLEWKNQQLAGFLLEVLDTLEEVSRDQNWEELDEMVERGFKLLEECESGSGNELEEEEEG